MITQTYRSVFKLLALLALALLALSYVPWVDWRITASPDKIMEWYPSLGALWLMVRPWLRGSLAGVAVCSAAVALLPLAKQYAALLQQNKATLSALFGRWMQQMSKAFLYTCYTIGASVLLFVLLNVISWGLLGSPLQNKDYIERLQAIVVPAAYMPPSAQVKVDKDYIRQTIADNVRYTYLSNQEFDYYPRLENVHAPFRSAHINVTWPLHDLPHRLCGTEPTAPNRAVFCFGGSTTFGTLISDQHTWPAFLNQTLQQTDSGTLVRNYGFCGHNADQETAAFLELLRLGHRPSLAVFMDGINLGPPFSGSEYSLGIAERFEMNGPDFKLRHFLYQLPLLKLLMNEQIEQEMSLAKNETFELIIATDSTYNEQYANRVLHNVKLREQIGKLYGVKTITVLQPNVFYDYNYAYTNATFRQAVSPQVLSNYRHIYQQLIATHELVDLSGLLQQYGQPAVIDLLHYSPDFSLYLARQIATQFSLDTLPNYRFDRSAASTQSFNQFKK